MLLSRFWYVVLALLLGAATFVLFLATSMYNRVGSKQMGERLSADSQVVSWYLKNDARERSAQLIKFALNRDIAKYLDKSSASEAKVPDKAREKVEAALRTIGGQIDQAFSFDAVFAVDQHGRVVAHLGYPQASGMDDFELGGYPVVADALHGYLRDDTLVLDRLYRVVARPVEFNLGQLPAGAIVGARIIDDRFARELSSRTGAAVAFFRKGHREATGAPEGFDRSQLDRITSDMLTLDRDQDFQEKGRSQVRSLGESLGVQYTRLPGEAWALGAGYAVGRYTQSVHNPLDFFRQADDKDKREANILLAVGITLGAMLFGLLFTLWEHSRPLGAFKREAIRLAKGEANQLLPSKFRGIYRKIAADLNDGIDEVAAKGGIPRKAANLKQVLGDLPKEPKMSAFSFPGDGAAAPDSAADQGQPAPSAQRRLPPPPSAPGGPQPSSRTAAERAAAAPSSPEPSAAHSPGSKRLPVPPPRPPASTTSAADGAAPAEWHQVYDDFVAMKQECGESLKGFTYEKFEKTLKKTEAALTKAHGAKRVKFSVYAKDGKAALKAAPLKD